MLGLEMEYNGVDMNMDAHIDEKLIPFCIVNFIAAYNTQDYMQKRCLSA